MKPFSSVYYIQKNSKRVFSIIIIIGMLALCYLGGVYMDNIAAEAKALNNHQSMFVIVNSSYKDEDGKQFNEISQDLGDNNLIDYFQVGTNYVGYKTMFGFQNGSTAYCFTMKDFRRFNSYMNYLDEDFAIEDDMMILSKKEAKAMKVMQGDAISYDNEFVRNYHGSGEYRVGALIDVDAFVSYFITDDLENSSCLLILPKAEHQDMEYKELITEFKNKYDKLIINDNNYRIKNAKENYAINDVFFIAIIVL